MIVGLIWVVTCLFGSLPFWFSGCFASFVDCLFEASSGFTTTGATILPDIEVLPRGIQFWRCFTHWLGAWECWCWPRRCSHPWGPAPST